MGTPKLTARNAARTHICTKRIMMKPPWFRTSDAIPETPFRKPGLNKLADGRREQVRCRCHRLRDHQPASNVLSGEVPAIRATCGGSAIERTIDREVHCASGRRQSRRGPPTNLQ